MDTEGFPDSSVGKESACNAGDPGSTPGSGRSAGEGKSYPLQYSWASLVAQLVKNSPALPKTWVQSLGWDDPLEKGKATHSSILAWRIPRTRKKLPTPVFWPGEFHGLYSPWGCKESDTSERLSLRWHVNNSHLLICNPCLFVKEKKNARPTLRLVLQFL